MTAPSPVTLAWYAVDLKTGTILEELRSLSPSGGAGRKLGVSTSASFDLDLNGAPASWDYATTPGKTCLLAVDTQIATPVWTGIVLTRAGGSSSTLQLGAATPEAYFDRRYTGTYIAAAVDQAVLMTALGTPLLTDAPPFTFDAPNTGTAVATYSVLDGDDKTILSAFQELMAQSGGPEWTVDTVWADAAQTTISLVIRIRPKIGTQSATPEPVFDFPGCVSSYTLSESYETGKGATSVRAWGDGDGTARLKADVTATDLAATGWCAYEYRYTPTDGLTDPTALTAHATETQTQIRYGATAWTVEAVASRAPRLGTDWALGDSVRIQVTTSPRHPDGADTVSRCYAWTLDAAADTITPVLVEDNA